MDSSISHKVAKIMGLDKNEAKTLARFLPPGVHLTGETLEEFGGDIPYDIEEVLLDQPDGEYLLTIVEHISEALSLGGTLQQLVDCCAEFEFEDNHAALHVMLSELTSEDSSVEQWGSSDTVSGKIRDGGDVFIDVDGEPVSLIAALNLLDTDGFNTYRAEAECMALTDKPGAEAVTMEFAGTVLDHMLRQTSKYDGEYSREPIDGIVTIVSHGFHVYSDYRVEPSRNTVYWGNAVTAMLTNFPPTRQDEAISVNMRVYYEDDLVSIIDEGGEETMVPSKEIIAWFDNGDTVMHPITSRELSHAHSVDHATGELITPEEGVTFLGSREINPGDCEYIPSSEA